MDQELLFAVLFANVRTLTPLFCVEVLKNTSKIEHNFQRESVGNQRTQQLGNNGKCGFKDFENWEFEMSDSGNVRIRNFEMLNFNKRWNFETLKLWIIGNFGNFETLKL